MLLGQHYCGLTLLGSIPAEVLPPTCQVSLPNSGAKGSIAASACLLRRLTFFSIWSSRKIGLLARPPCKHAATRNVRCSRIGLLARPPCTNAETRHLSLSLRLSHPAADLCVDRCTDKRMWHPGRKSKQTT
eukprot:scaffold85200_cov18-Tisochrysis_lutea.AAC.2